VLGSIYVGLVVSVYLFWDVHKLVKGLFAFLYQVFCILGLLFCLSKVRFLHFIESVVYELLVFVYLLTQLFYFAVERDFMILLYLFKNFLPDFVHTVECFIVCLSEF